MDRVRARVKDKRVLALVKAFLKAGILTELGEPQDTLTGTPQGGILSPLLANIALSALDEHVMAPWRPGGVMSTVGKRAYRRSKGRPTWRITRYADDFVILVHGSRADTEALREDVADTLAPLGLRLSPAKTQVVHMSDGFDFLGFRIRWKRQRGSNKWYVYTFIADRPVRGGEGQDPCPDPQDIAAGHRACADPAGSDHARMGQLLQTRGGQSDLQQIGQLHLVETCPHAAGPAPLELGTAPPPPDHPHRAVADRGGRD
jgi:Reverse transcriptase (RNA-dependent DNA polymerase)